MPELSPRFLRRYMPRLPGDGITMTFLIDAEGTVVTCEVESDDVSDEKAAEYCEKTIGRTAGKPAIGPDGSAVGGFVTGFVMSGPRSMSKTEIERANADQSPVEPDFTLTVSRLPGGGQKATVGMLVSFDQTGKARKCQPTSEVNGQLLEIACLQTLQLSFPVQNGSDGTPMPYNDDILVGFEVEDKSGEEEGLREDSGEEGSG